MKSGLVSTILPVHNRPELLVEAVNSVLTQSYDNIEIIVVDDCSTDQTSGVINELCDRHPEIVFTEKTDICSGPGVARQLGLEQAQGEFIQYLDSDDLLLPDKFQLQVNALANNSNAGVAYGFTRFQKSDGQFHPEPWKGSGISRKAMFPAFLVERWWDTPNPLYRRSICDQAGPWLPLWQEEDWEYDCRIAAVGQELAHVQEYVCVVRSHQDDRLSNAQLSPMEKLKNRAKAQISIFESATSGNMDYRCQEFISYPRSLFLISRQCGESGLKSEANQLISLAARAARLSGSSVLEYRFYQLCSNLIGWSTMQRLSNRFRKPI